MTSAIRDREQATQLVDFAGLSWGRMSPTNIDALIEMGGRVFVFIEAKYGDAPMPRGQRLALERTVDAIHQPPHRYAAAIVCEHDGDGDVFLAETSVREWRWDGRWREPQQGIALREALDRLFDFYGPAEGAR